MRILAHCYTYGHNSASGADKMLQSVLEYLSERGCECRVVIDNCPTGYELNGVSVSTNKSMLGEQYDWCDIVIIHLVALHEAVLIARRFDKPIVHICHNNHTQVSGGYVIYNTHWLAAEMHLPLPSIVVHPPTRVPELTVSHFAQPYITLVNTNDNKGGTTLRNLAIQMPAQKFLGIHGGYDKNQMYQPVKNVTYRPYSPAGMDYSDTRIIIVPSKAESWSLVAAEAMANGIPVICSDLPGLRENCGDAAIYANSVGQYVDAIKLLRDEEIYNWYATLGREQAASHNYNDELNNLYNFIQNIVMEKKKDGDKKKVVVPGSKKPTQSKGVPKEKREYKNLPTQK